MGPEPTYPQGIDAAPPTWVWAVTLFVIAVNCGLGLLLLATAAQQAIRRRRGERIAGRFVVGVDPATDSTTVVVYDTKRHEVVEHWEARTS
jgi:hypothetical protein